jgi:hypothetical protein
LSLLISPFANLNLSICSGLSDSIIAHLSSLENFFSFIVYGYILHL